MVMDFTRRVYGTLWYDIHRTSSVTLNRLPDYDDLAYVTGRLTLVDILAIRDMVFSGVIDDFDEAVRERLAVAEARVIRSEISQ